MTTLRLPFPPTVNNLFINKGKARIRSPRYDAWRAEAGAMLIEQSPRRVFGAFELSIHCERPDRRARDVANLIKAVEDLLVHHQVIEDDSLAQSVSIAWLNTMAKPAHVYVYLTALTAQARAA